MPGSADSPETDFLTLLGHVDDALLNTVERQHHTDPEFYKDMIKEMTIFNARFMVRALQQARHEKKLGTEADDAFMAGIDFVTAPLIQLANEGRLDSFMKSILTSAAPAEEKTNFDDAA